ncbi:ornithine cyclodeaminase family protein [Streptosporangium sandarakinum]|uniref:ornithine cyclodeaminase family protein n=1 Tax=Streptosporangium TaxID=2000 RepID=UPI0031F8FDB4
MSGTVILGQEHLEEIIRVFGRDHVMDLLMGRLTEALANTRAKTGQTPPRSGFVRCPQDSGVLEWMPHREPGRAVTIKTVAYTPTNPTSSNLPTILGAVSRFDDLTGRLVAVCDGVLLTALRTGAASAIASRLLAHPDSAVLGMVGAGAQAVTQVHALSRVLPLRQVLVHDVDRRRAADLAHRVAFTGVEVRVAETAEIEASADVICTVTSVAIGAGPVLGGNGLKPHAHVNAVGSDLPGKTELPLALLRTAAVFPDHTAQALREGECQQLEEHGIGPELADLCAEPELARQYAGRLTVFDSTGFALEDHVALDVLLELAADCGVGWQVQIEHLPGNAVDPYAFSMAAEARAEKSSRPTPAGSPTSGRMTVGTAGGRG